MFGSIGMPELLVILVILLIIFGHDKLPALGSSLGKAINQFKKAVEGPEKKSVASGEPRTIDNKKD